MPHSDHRFDREIREWVVGRFPAADLPKILDVGAGAGKMRDLLADYAEVHALEPHAPYIERFGLRRRYASVCESPADLGWYDEFWKGFDLVIFGDVLEHIEASEAARLVEKIAGLGVAMLVAVPYLYEQDAVDGVEWERHRQPDLTPAVMATRYPKLTPLVHDDAMGVYVYDPAAPVAAAAQLGETTVRVSYDELRKETLLIATPCLGTLTREYVVSLVATVAELQRIGIACQVMFSESTVEKARNVLVANFMANPRFTRLLFVDSDQGWEPADVLRLLAYRKDVVGIAARKKVAEMAWAVNLPPGELVLEDGLLECFGLGTGFMMISRAAIQRMMDAYPQLAITAHSETEAPKGCYYALFEFALVETAEGRSHVSEDLMFCRRWRELGGKVYVEPTGVISHIGRADYRGSLDAALRSA